jgi:hypothetical protein
MERWTRTMSRCVLVGVEPVEFLDEPQALTKATQASAATGPLAQRRTRGTRVVFGVVVSLCMLKC